MICYTKKSSNDLINNLQNKKKKLKTKSQLQLKTNHTQNSIWVLWTQIKKICSLIEIYINFVV